MTILIFLLLPVHPVKIMNFLHLNSQEWALKTYGDSAKTKTVTHKKYSRIVKILRGEESSSMENSKFRFWVKAKGFRLELTDGDASSGILYVPASKSTSVSRASVFISFTLSHSHSLVHFLVYSVYYRLFLDLIYCSSETSRVKETRQQTSREA